MVVLTCGHHDDSNQLTRLQQTNTTEDNAHAGVQNELLDESAAAQHTSGEAHLTVRYSTCRIRARSAVKTCVQVGVNHTNQTGHIEHGLGAGCYKKGMDKHQ